MLRAYKFRLYPTREQKFLIEKHFGACRLVYNLALNTKQSAYRSFRKKISRFDLNKQLVDLKEGFDWLFEINSQSLQCSLLHLDNAFINFFQGRTRYPQFKSKKDKQSFSCPQKVYVDFEKQLLDIPKFKEPISIVLHRKFKGKIKTVTISKTPTGKYFASILVDNEKELPAKLAPDKSKAVGLDMGITHLATVGNIDLTRSFKIENPKHLRRNIKLIKRRGRQHSKKKNGSKNREKARLKLARLHERIANRRNDFLHKVSYRLASDNQATTICKEDLNVRGMMRNHKLAQAIGDVAWGTFFTYLKYKCDWNGKNFLQSERFSPTSKECHVCHKPNKLLTLSVREWICEGCGTIHDRDENACPNIIASAFDKYEKNRDGLPESTLGESTALPLPKGKRQQKTKNQEKFRKKSVLRIAS